MADPPPYPGTPRWEKVSGIIVGVLVLVFVILQVTGVGPGAGGHGPGMRGGGGGDSPPASVTEDGGQQP